MKVASHLEYRFVDPVRIVEPYDDALPPAFDGSGAKLIDVLRCDRGLPDLHRARPPGNHASHTDRRARLRHLRDLAGSADRCGSGDVQDRQLGLLAPIRRGVDGRNRSPAAGSLNLNAAPACPRGAVSACRNDCSAKVNRRE